LDADFESDAGAERGLFKNEGNKFAVQGGSVADGASFDIRGEMEEVASVHGTPFASGEEIVR